MRPERCALALAAALALVACSRPKPSPDAEGVPNGAERLPNGVASLVLASGRGVVHAGANDCVRVRYLSWKRTSPVHRGLRGDPELLCLPRAMPGLQSVLTSMVAGEQRRVWIPGSLTFRAHGADAPAPADDLVVEVELLDVLKAPEAPASLLAPPASAERTESGLVREVLRPGQGTRRARPAERVKVRLSAWTRDGAVYETTELDGRPTSISRADVVPGLGEGLALMQVGEKARLWVPAALAFGEHPRRGRPAGALVYDVELLAIE